MWPSLLGASDTPNVLDRLLVLQYGTVELMGRKVSPTLYVRAKYGVDDTGAGVALMRPPNQSVCCPPVPTPSHGEIPPAGAGPKKAVLNFTVVDASFGAPSVVEDSPFGACSAALTLRGVSVQAGPAVTITPAAPFLEPGNISGLNFTGTVEVTPVPDSGPVPRVVSSRPPPALLL